MEFIRNVWKLINSTKRHIGIYLTFLALIMKYKAPKTIPYLQQGRHHDVIGGALAVGGLELERLTGQLLLEDLVVLHALEGGVNGGRVELLEQGGLHAGVGQSLQHGLLG